MEMSVPSFRRLPEHNPLIMVITADITKIFPFFLHFLQLCTLTQNTKIEVVPCINWPYKLLQRTPLMRAID